MAKVMLVEDEDLVAMLAEDMIEALGHTMCASAATLSEGVRLAEQADIELAMLDVNLRGLLSFPIADILTARGVPFFFASGYTAQAIEPRFAGVPRLQKPFTLDELKNMLNATLTRRT